MSRRTFTASLCGRSVTISAGLSPSTQTSAERTPSPMEKARASGSSEMRQKPPGITRQPSGVAAAKTRKVKGRGESRPSSQKGVVESFTTSWPT